MWRLLRCHGAVCRRRDVLTQSRRHVPLGESAGATVIRCNGSTWTASSLVGTGMGRPARVILGAGRGPMTLRCCTGSSHGALAEAYPRAALWPNLSARKDTNTSSQAAVPNRCARRETARFQSPWNRSSDPINRWPRVTYPKVRNRSSTCSAVNRREAWPPSIWRRSSRNSFAASSSSSAA